MVRHLFIVVSLLWGAFVSAAAQDCNSVVCRLGFTYDISQSKNWGYRKPVINSVIPYSSAEQAGVKRYDVIEAIDGVAVTDVSVDEIAQLLNPAGKNEVTLAIRNLSSASAKHVIVKKDCKKSDAITEDQLASAFAMYSLETTGERDFVCPFRTTVTADSVDFGNFRTFAFSPVDESNRQLELVINDCIEEELLKKGLTKDLVKPDILIQTFYFFDKNPNFMGVNKVQVKKEPTYRYNSVYGKMERFPFLDYAMAESEAEYLLQFGLRLIDQKEVPGRVLWECEANEMLEESFRLDEYARVHVPLMCLQYPYAKYGRNVPFRLRQKTYNYTGISYDINELALVVDVDKNSPAYAAGVRPRDVIERIGRNKMGYSAEEFSSAYKRFISRTMEYRDPKTLFTDANGFRYCMFWDVFKYPQIADEVRDADYLPAFSYLYYFAPYINPSGNNACTFYIQRGKKRLEVIIRPTIRSEAVVEVK